MLDKLPIEELAKRLSDAVPQHGGIIQDVEKTFHGILQAAFTKMNLVSREEFEVQRAVLAKTREKLERVEQQLADLEKDRLQP